MQQDRPYHAPGDDGKPAFLRALMGDDVSLAQAFHEIHRRHFAGRAAASTVEALMLGLCKRGTAALKEPKARRRLGELSVEQLRELRARLQRLKGEIAKAWTADEIDRLLETWDALHAR